MFVQEYDFNLLIFGRKNKCAYYLSHYRMYCFFRLGKLTWLSSHQLLYLLLRNNLVAREVKVQKSIYFDSEYRAQSFHLQGNFLAKGNLTV